MCRTVNSLLLMLVLLVTVGSTRTAAADDVANYLERVGLLDLLAVHLEEQLDAAPLNQREALVSRLAGVYARLLERELDPRASEALQQRGRKLLDQASDDTADELRLALLRASFRAAERIAENHRLRMAEPDDVAQAVGILADSIPRLNRLRTRLEERYEATELRLGRSSGTAAVLLAEELDDLDRLVAQTRFINGWALYYKSWLDGSGAGSAAAAIPLFGQILAGSPHPNPDEVSRDLRHVEAIARSILGMALCKSLTAAPSVAQQWLDLLDEDGVNEDVRAELPAWRMAIMLEEGDFRGVRRLWETQQAERGDDLPIAWVRLVGVFALENTRRSPDAEWLARQAVTTFAARNELEQVLDLANRYGLEALDDSGFAVTYVRGVQAYQAARKMHDSDLPTADETIRAQYQSAAVRFDEALAQPDRAEHPGAAANCQWLVGWCRYFRGEFLTARHAFEAAAEVLPADQAPEALWMAIASIDKVLAAANRPNEALEADLAQLISRFLATYPANEHAPQLIVRRTLSEEASPALVDELLTVPPNSDLYDQAQRRAAQMLYRLYRDSSDTLRTRYGTRFLAVMIPILTGDYERFTSLDDVLRQQFVLGCRQVLDVALQKDVRRLVAARQAMRWMKQLQEDGDIAVEDLADELDYRVVQERVLADDLLEARAYAQRLIQRDAESTWARGASRLLFAEGRRRWQLPDNPDEDNRVALDLVVTYGMRIVDELREAMSNHDDPRLIGYTVSVADAAIAIYERSADQSKARLAKDLYEDLLVIKPRDTSFLRATATLSEALGDSDRAIECWRVIASAGDVIGEAFYEAKFRLITLLSVSDPVRARAVMDQHRSLHPDYGPDPWGVRMEALDRRLPANGDREATP